MDREEIIKALECCGCVGIPLHDCGNCAYKDTYYCHHVIAQDTLDLIKELIKEKEEQHSFTEVLLKNNEELEIELSQTYDLLDETKAKTVQKMVDMLKRRLPIISPSVFNQIAKRVLEDKE